MFLSFFRVGLGLSWDGPSGLGCEPPKCRIPHTRQFSEVVNLIPARVCVTAVKYPYIGQA